MFIIITIIFLAQNLTRINSGEMTLTEALKNFVHISDNVNFIKGSKNSIKEQHQKYLNKVVSKDKKINILASHLTHKCNKNKVCETSRLLNYVSNEVKYKTSLHIKAPHETLETLSGNSEDQTILLISLLESLGINSYMVFTDNHIYPLVCFKKAIKTKRYLNIENQYCYHLEPIAKGSTIGYFHKARNIKAIYNTKTKKTVFIKK